MKIFHVEGSATDAEPAFAVKSREDFLRVLPGGHDILFDFNLINFNGLEPLQLAREQVPGTPVVFLSGTLDEDRALEALRSGATNCAIKDSPKRLTPALRCAPGDAQLAREREAAEEQILRVQRLENIGMLAILLVPSLPNQAKVANSL